jgi:predicted TPR repeat methyltransferase
VLCCDTFIYVGDLSSVFAGVREVLAPGGSFGFTVEACEAEQGFELLPSLRYAHTERYIRQLADRHAFRFVGHREGPLRTEANVPVRGLAFHFANARP